MSTYEFPKDEEIDEHVPDDEQVEDVKYVGNTEVVETSEHEYECDECGDTFATEEARNGHMATHEEED